MSSIALPFTSDALLRVRRDNMEPQQAFDAIGERKRQATADLRAGSGVRSL